MRKLRLVELRKLAQSYGVFLPRQMTKKELEILLERKLKGLSVREVKGKIQRTRSESELPIESRELRRAMIRLGAKLAACESENKLLTEMLGKRARTIERLNGKLKQLDAEASTEEKTKPVSVQDIDRSNEESLEHTG